MFLRSKKVISILLVFVILFTYTGQTLEAVATTDGLSLVTNGFFKSEKMKLNSYFIQDEIQSTEKISNVNEKATLVLEIEPNEIGKGFLKTGTILASNLEQKNVNFKFSKITNVSIDEQEETAQYESINEVSEIPQIVENTAVSEESNTISTEMTTEQTESELPSEDAKEIQETYEELTAKDFEIEIIGDHEIKVQNVIYHTTIEVEIEYNKQEQFTTIALFEEINLKLSGTYININLEKMETEVAQNIMVGWSYHQEMELAGEYTQVSPFQLGDYRGTIIQNKITVTRETEEQNCLPIKQTTLEISVPDWNGKAPETVNVQATKLMATKGEDIGNVTFGNDNWNYDTENKKITITVDNQTSLGMGEDEYIILYRYNEYIEEKTVTLPNNFKVTVEEYSGNSNEITVKEWNNTQEIKTQADNLITYNINSTKESLNKAKINANYYMAEANYESEFTTTVNVNILTNDLLEELKINSSKEIYVTKEAVEFDATPDIDYNKIKFNYSEIKNILQNGATIEIQTLSGEVIQTLDNDNVTSQEHCEVQLQGQEKGILVVFKNIAMNGNIGIEFTKAIGKSNYEQSAFQSFDTIKSYVSAELKYQNKEDKYLMNEIATTKKLQDSQTSAEIQLTNQNLNTIAQNNGVEVKIILNNNKSDSDFFKNPSFELVFPKYITDVVLEKSNLLYNTGLEISNIETYKENNLIKMKIDLVGTQNGFCESNVTNGTNIVLNLKLTLNEYTPKKQDQIKLYYCNEAVTKYESETAWTIHKAIPNGILKETNGFDVATINYQAPSGVITSNAILNYDGKASQIKSINQGTKTVQIERNRDSQIATMELVTMNNSKNNCSDMVLLGRIPFQGNTSVISGEDLGTTENVKLLGGIQENIQNPNMTTIYYSTNEAATKDLNNSNNGWTKNVSNWSEVKSYMIVLKGEVKPGVVLKYTYDFEIPEELQYEKAIYGSFGGYYNRKQEKMISYESTEASKVGLITETKPNINVQVYPYGEQQEVQDGQIVTLVAKVENNSKIDLENATLKVSVPTGTRYVKQEKQETEEETTYRYVEDKDVLYQEFQIKRLVAGEITYFEFEVKVLEGSSQQFKKLEGYTDMNGIIQDYNLKVKPSLISVTATLLEDERNFLENTSIDFGVLITNSNSAPKENYKMSFSVPDYLTIDEVYDYNVDKALNFSVKDRKVIIDVGELNAERTEIVISCTIGEINVKELTMKTIFNVYPSNDEKNGYSSEVVKSTIRRIYAQLSQEISASTLHYTDDFTYRAILQNQSDIDTSFQLKMNLPSNLFVKNMSVIINGKEEKIDAYYYNDYEIKRGLPANGKVEIIATGRVTNKDTIIGSRKFSQTLSAQLGNGVEIKSEALPIRILTSDDFAQNTENSETTEKNKDNPYSISGNIGMDEETKKEQTPQVQVQLLKEATTVKTTTTDTEGNYTFDNLQAGDYTVVCNYDKERYTAEDTENTSIIETQEGTSVTDKITIENESRDNINMTLKEKGKFDFAIKQYITGAIVNIRGQETEYSYDKLELAKIEINPADLKDAVVKLNYKIIVTNVGNQEGQVSSIVDYLPNGITFDQSENPDWTIGTIEGNIYYDGLKGVPILPGESQEILLTLNKKMTEDNTGVVSNKVQIAYAESESRLTEAIEGNFASQETIITPTQGIGTGLKITVTTISIAGMAGLFGYMVQTGKWEEIRKKKWIKKVYK